MLRFIRIPMLSRINRRWFSNCGINLLKANELPPRPKFQDESEIEEVFIKGGGNGGQKINKTNSKVQLRHIPTGIVVNCQETRSREQNRKIARKLLAQKLQDLSDPENSRTKVLAERERNKKRVKTKKAKEKYEEQKLSKKDNVDEELSTLQKLLGKSNDEASKES